MVSGSMLVLYVQEVLAWAPLCSPCIGIGGALGGVVGGTVASWASKRLGSGACLAVVLGGTALLISSLVGVRPLGGRW